MNRSRLLVALLCWLVSAGAHAAGTYEFGKRQLTANGLTKNSIAMRGAVAAWVSCEPDPIDEWDPATCEIWVYDANTGAAAQPITDNAVEDECVAIDGRDVAFRRASGAGQVVVRDLDAGETIVSSAGVDTAFTACPQLSETRVVWQRGGQVVVYDRALASERVVGASASWMELSLDYVVWQEGEGDAAEIWFLDASSANPPERITDDAIPDERPHVHAVTNHVGFPPVLVVAPAVVWNRTVDGRREVAAWDGADTIPVTASSAESQFFPQVTGWAPTLFSFERAAAGWGTNSALRFCTTCDGNPLNLRALPAADPFLDGSPNTSLEDLEGGWLLFSRVFPGPDARFDLGFYELGIDAITPITDDAELDDAGEIGFRSMEPFGPAVVWRRSDGGTPQIFYAPEPRAAAFAALGALGALARRRAARRGDTRE